MLLHKFNEGNKVEEMLYLTLDTKETETTNQISQHVKLMEWGEWFVYFTHIFVLLSSSVNLNILIKS